MSIVSLLGINVLNNPAKFTDPYEFEITFECLEPLKDGKLLQINKSMKYSEKNRDFLLIPL